MVQKQVLKSSDRCIYRIQESNLDFYMIIPNSPRVSLVLGLMDGVGDEKVTQLSHMQDKTVVIPVLDERVFKGIIQSQREFFEYLDKYFSSLINLSHKILTHNKIQVLDTIYFYSQEEYKNFQRWFIEKYNGRVQAMDISFETLQSVVQSPEPVQSVDANVGNVTPVSPVEPSKVEKLDVEETVAEVMPTERKEPGFVSYVLLGVLVAVLSLVFLYFIV